MDSDSFDTLATSELLALTVRLAREDTTGDGDSRWTAVSALRRRPEPAVFQRAIEWCASPNARDRALGAEVLAQLGAPDRPFATDSTPVLLNLLQDPDEHVMVAALYALGHLRTGASADLAVFARHPSTCVRQAAAHALGGRDDPAALDSLRLLSADADTDVRNWATFGLGSLCESDSPEIRDALAERLAEDDDEIRGEALVGLARRRDPRALAAIRAELVRPEVPLLAIEAAEIMPSAEFVGPLVALVRSAPTETALRALQSCEAAADSPDA